MINHLFILFWKQESGNLSHKESAEVFRRKNGGWWGGAGRIAISDS